MRPAWSQGRNYDVSLLTVSLATSGFILGEAILGTSVLGDTGSLVPFDVDFTSIMINEPTTVEDGLFVHREVATCNLSATLPSMLDLRGRFIVIAYDGQQLFAGRISRVSWTESVDVDRAFLPGNTATKTYRMSLQATTGEETLAGTAAQITGQPWELALNFPADRIENLTGYPVTKLDAAADIPLSTFNAGFETLDPATLLIPYASRAYLAGDRQSLLDALRMEAKSIGCVFVYQPRDPINKFVLQPVNRWLTGDLKADALYFTDEAVTSPTTDAGDDFLTTDRRVSFTERQVSEDPSLFVNSVVFKFSRYDAVDDPTEWTFGPYRAGDLNPQDVEIDYGLVILNAAGDEADEAYRFARSVVQTLPLKRTAEPYTSSLEGPLQSTRQLEGTVPGMAVLKADGVEQRVAILGRTHTITPSRWMVSYETGPEHLLSRTSDREPGPATDVSHNKVSGVDHFYWTVPDRPTDATFYEYYLYFPSGSWAVHWRTSDQIYVDFALYAYGLADPPGTARHTQITTAAGAALFVMYTSNPLPTSDNPNDIWREGQLTYLGLTG